MVVKKIVMPKRYLKKDKFGKTRFVQQKSTGLMQGRERVKHGSDGTKAMRLTKDVDVTGDKKPDYFAGEIFGRSPKSIRGDSRKRGTIRRF